MKTLVTGATGFLGAHLLDALDRTLGLTEVRVLTQSDRTDLAQRGIEVVQGSITCAADVARAVVGVDRIYHLAGFVSVKGEDAARMYDVHVNGTRLLSQAARAAGVERILLVSTSGTVAVSTRATELPDESSPAPVELLGRWPYYASKLYQEETARHFCGDAVELITVNPSLLLGPGDDRLSSTRPILSFLSRDVPLIPNGGLNFVDVRDVAAALPTAMERGRAGERYLLGGYNWTFEDFLGRLSRLSKVPGPVLKFKGRLPYFAAHAQAALYKRLGQTPPVEPENVEMAEHFWYFESTKAREELDFTVRDATDTLFETIQYLRTHILGEGDLFKAAQR